LIELRPPDIPLSSMYHGANVLDPAQLLRLVGRHCSLVQEIRRVLLVILATAQLPGIVVPLGIVGIGRLAMDC